MTREEFIQRLEEIRFNRVPDSIGDIWTNGKYFIRILYHFDVFLSGGFEYAFDELDQFLVDKCIVEKEKPFDPHEYLLSQGFTISFYGFYNNFYKKNSNNYCISAHSHKMDDYAIILWVENTKIIGFKDLTKKSLKKAINVVDVLDGLKREND